MRAVELFSGMGVSALGVTQAGITLVGAVENNSKLVELFNSQTILPPVAIDGDVGKTQTEKTDLVCAGPVCKAFSPGATLFGTAGARDNRNTFPALLRHVDKYRPDHLLIENSYGLQRFSGYIGELKARLKQFGYHVEFDEIDCFDYGVPQHRRRVVFLCSTKKEWKVERPKTRPKAPATVGDCLSPPPKSDKWPLLIPLSPRGLDYFTRDPRHAKKHPPLTLGNPASTVVSVYRKGVPYGIVEKNGTLYHCGPRLAARLQGIPDSYDMSAISKTLALDAIGGGFPPQVVKYLLKGI